MKPCLLRLTLELRRYSKLSADAACICLALAQRLASLNHRGVPDGEQSMESNGAFFFGFLIRCCISCDFLEPISCCSRYFMVFGLSHKSIIFSKMQTELSPTYE